MRFMVATASAGYWPAADSADSITASAPSKIAVATSDTSARVGTGLRIIDSSIWVATTTGLPARQDAVAGLDRRQNFRMRKLDAGVVAGCRIGIKLEACILGQGDRSAREGADPQFWPLQVDQHTDRPPILELDRADRGHQIAHALM